MTKHRVPIEGYESLYEISGKGRVRACRTRNSPTTEYIKPYAHGGCLNVYLIKQGHRKSFCLHILVAKAYVPNPEKRPAVLFKDGNRFDPHSINLIWSHESNTVKSCRGKKTGASSKYHHVTWCKRRKRWLAVITIKGKALGYRSCKTEKEAALYVNYLIESLGLTDRPKNIIE